ncbi:MULTISPECIES: hypothetical protein [Nostocales]|uniref:Transposase n=2 Tax=Nostocales TaxID=1161 RepID=A0ABW8WZF2_9CYAN
MPTKAASALLGKVCDLLNVTIEIPRSNQLTPDALQAIIQRISFGGLP